MSEQLPYRENVCMLVINQAGELFVGERSNEPGHWQFPQGGVEEGATLEENVLRELEEEIGVSRDKLKILKRLNATHQYDFRNPPAYAVGKYRGQTQTFWLVQFLGIESDLNLNAHSPEFMAYKWLKPKEVLSSVSPLRAPGYSKPIDEVVEYLNNR